LRGSSQLADVSQGSRIDLSFLGGDGAPRLVKLVTAGGSGPLSVKLTNAEIALLTADDPQPDPASPIAQRHAYFVPTSDTRVPFEASPLQIAPVALASGGWKRLGLNELFYLETPVTSTVQWPASGWPQSGFVTWTSTHVAIDGQFSFVAPQSAGDAWMWWLSGRLPALGIVLDALLFEVVATVTGKP